jgi:hypothetical protein
MRKTILFLLFILAAPVLAQTPTPTPTAVPVAISFSLNQGRANKLDRARRQINTDTCRRCGQAVGCTQAQARSVPRCSTVDVYSTLSDFVDRFVVANYATASLDQLADAYDYQDVIAWWWSRSAGTRNADCAAAGLPNGCGPGPTPTPTPTP